MSELIALRGLYKQVVRWRITRPFDDDFPQVLNDVCRAQVSAEQYLNTGVDLVDFIHKQRDWSEKTFGPGARTEGVIDHIQKELIEVKDNPKDVFEWIDLIILAFDGAWREGFEPEEIAAALKEKQYINSQREWPDWREAEPGKAIEHVRE